MKDNPDSHSSCWRGLVPSVALLLLSACGGGGGGGESGGSDPGAGSNDPGTTIDKNASVSARSTPLGPGDPACPHGGILVETGIDENGNGVLDDDEVDAAEKVCNGAPGSNGADGRDGLDSLVAFNDEPAGANCPWGGMRVESGLDANRDGILQPGEVNETRFVCSLVDSNIGWQVGETIDASIIYSAISPTLAVAENGSAIALWAQRDSSNTRWDLWARRYDSADGWDAAATLIETADGTVINFILWSPPTIAIAPDGSAIALWTQRDVSDTRWDLWANRFVPDAGWGTAELIETGSEDASRPRIAVTADGSAIAVWQQGGDIWANHYLPGFGWGSAQAIESGSGYADRPTIAMATDGSAITVWQQGGDIWANHYLPGVGWGSAQAIDSGSGYADRPVIAMAADGSAIVLWPQEGDIGWYDLWANRYDPGSGNWGTAQLLAPSTSFSSDSPAIAMAADGSAIAVWRQQNGGNYDLHARRYDPASQAWSVSQAIENRLGTPYSLTIAMAPDGSALTLWHQEDGTRMAIWSNRFVPRVGWGVAQPVERNAAGDARSPQIGFDGDGNAISVWQQNSTDGTHWDIWAARWLAP